jgi:serine/threonine protein kinase/tetratricopeptide (TPR) repeat protein
MKCPRCHIDNSGTSRFCASCGASLLDSAIDSASARTRTFVSEEEFAPGTIFAGRYQLIEEIGRGGMGKVLKALDTKVQAKVALKVVRSDIRERPKMIERFRNELKLARQITHKNVCRMYDLGEEEGTVFISMEYVPGESLDKIIRMTGPLPPETVINYCRQIGEGLAEAHKLGVVHRDLKPHNIMIDEGGTVKIMDFGIARSIETKGLTKDGALIGTPEYMSPEQAQGKSADNRSDMYALGIVMYEMLTGKVPFSGDTPFAIALKQKDEAPVPPIALDDRILEPLNSIVMKCLEKDPAKRYQSAEEFLADLEADRKSYSPHSRETPAPSRSILAPGKKRRIFVLSSVFIGLLIVAGFIALKIVPGRKPGNGTKAQLLKRLAVLPLQDASPDKSQGDLCEGISRDLRIYFIDRKAYPVVSSSSSDQFKDTTEKMENVGRLLNTRYILSGEMNAQKDRFNVSMVLSDAESGNDIWSYRYDDTLIPFQELPARIVAEVLGSLPQLSSGEPPQPAPARATNNPETYKHFIYARECQIRYREEGKEPDFVASEKLYKAALAQDPGYAEALCGLGDLYEARFVNTKDPKYQALMIQQFNEAYRLYPNIADSQLGMGWSSFYQEDIDQASRFFKKAYDINPQNAEVALKVGAFLRSIGLYDRAIGYLSQAAELDPRSTIPLFQMASCYWYIANYEKSFDVLGEIKIIAPQNIRVHLYRARAYLSGKGFIKAREELILVRKSYDLLSSRDQGAFDRCWIWLLAGLGEKEKALELMKTVARPFGYEIANVLTLLGRPKEAIAKIREGIDVGFRESGDYMYNFLYLSQNPYFARLKPDPEFLTILATARARYEMMLKTYDGL